MVATFSGINSIQALFTAGVAIPEPMPEIKTTNDSIHGVLVLASYAKNVVRLEIRVENFLPMW